MRKELSPFILSTSHFVSTGQVHEPISASHWIKLTRYKKWAHE